MELAEAIQLAKEVTDLAAQHVQARTFEPTLRKRLAGASFQLALEHQRSMVILIQAGASGSALALLRCVIETFAQGYWLLYRANENELERFQNGRLTWTLDPLLRQIAQDEPNGPTVEQLQNLARRANALTHGGIEHLVMRQGTTVLGPQYDPDDLSDALGVGAWAAGMAALDIVGGIIGDEERATIMQVEVHDLLRQTDPASRAIS